MRTLKSHLEKKFLDKDYEKQFYRELEKTRIALEITYHREKAGLTQNELADSIGTSQSTIARLEDPDYNRYSIQSLRKIGEVLNLELIVTYREKQKDYYKQMLPSSIYIVQESVWTNKARDGFKYNISKMRQSK